MRARHLHVLPGKLPGEAHREIDAETSEWAETQLGLVVVEGRYLQYVMIRTRAQIRLVEIVCEDSERELRWAKQMGRPLGPDELPRLDATDRDFVSKMYNVTSPLMPGLRVDTTSSDVNECVQQILDWLN